MSRTTVEAFDDIGAFLRRLERPEYGRTRSAQRNDGSWSGAASLADAARIVRQGRLEQVAEVERILDRVDAAGINTVGSQWEPAVSGPLPIVPQYLAGLPDCMMRPVEVRDASKPLRVFLSVCVSAGVDERTLAKRGAAVLALVTTLARQRPTQAVLFSDMGGRDYLCTPLVPLDTSPMDLATATAAFSSAAFLRKLLFAWAEHACGWEGMWAWNSAPSGTNTLKRTRAAIGAAPDDVVILGGHVSDADEMIRDPVAWVNKRVAETRELQAEAA